MQLKLASRTSELALYQTNLVKDLLLKADAKLSVEIVGIKTKGDQDQHTKLQHLGQTGVFTRAIDNAVLDGLAHVGVHSLKDYPSQMPEGLEIYAVLERDGFLDAFIPGNDFDDNFDQELSLLSGSPRREAQWRNKYPNHRFSNLRGNMDTRLEKIRNADGGIISLPGLQRINKLPSDAIALEWMVPAPSQGIMVVIGKSNHAELKAIFQQINHEPTAYCAAIERRVMQLIEAGCAAPLGVLAQLNKQDKVQVTACLHSLDGQEEVRFEQEFDMQSSENIAQAIAQHLLENGGAAIMKHIKSAQAKDILMLREAEPEDRSQALEGNIKLHDVQVYQINSKPLPTPPQADAMILSSPHALNSIEEQLRNYPEKAYVVGERALKALRELNYQGEIQQFNYAKDLIASIENSSERLVFPCAMELSKAWSLISSDLKQRINFTPSYQANLLPLRLARQSWDGIAAFSSRALEHLQQENHIHLNTPVFCVGQSTAETASTLGFNTVYIAKNQNTKAVIELIKSHFNDQK